MNLDLGFLINLVIYLLVFGIIIGILLYIVENAPFIQGPWKPVIRWIIIAVAGLILIGILLQLLPPLKLGMLPALSLLA